MPPTPCPACCKGAAPKAIHDRGLYREHGTWEAYCADVWGYSRPFAYQVIAAAEAVENVSANGRHPSNERQVRPLTLLRKPDPDDPAKTIQDADAQREAWKEAVETAPEGKVTGALCT